jgi:hypothetical protein
VRLTAGKLYVLGLLAFGIITGLAVAKIPALAVVPIPAFTLPLIASLIADLALMPLGRAGRIEPLTMEQRLIGVVGASLVATGVLALLT